jgi:hypothetical protein
MWLNRHFSAQNVLMPLLAFTMTASQATTKAIQNHFDRITFLNPSDIRTIEDRPATVVNEIWIFA